MQIDLRREPRRRSRRVYSISWKDEDGTTHSTQVTGIDESASGIGFRCPVEIPKGTIVYIQAEDEYPTGYSVVRHAASRGNRYVVGVELDEAAKAGNSQEPEETVDFYEFLQINPKAQAETIQRVYRFLAARYHPDNPDTGDPEKFLRLNKAYETLSDPARRLRYDDELRAKKPKPSEVFESVDFLDGVDGEINRRLAVLSLLYRNCRNNVHNPQVSLLDLEGQMGFPRDFLDFTIWYLRSKKLIKQEDNAALSLTCEGVDFVEDNFDKLPLLGKLLAAGKGSVPRAESPHGPNNGRPQQADMAHRLPPGTPTMDAADMS
jgi:curved DNA-binding protein CbpA